MPNTSTSGSLGGGVTGSVTSGGEIGHTVILPATMAQRTRTTIGPTRVEFSGALQVLQGDRIHAGTKFDDDLQKRIAELVQPGITSKSGLAGLFTMTSIANSEKSSIRNETSDREEFLDNARADFENSPWSAAIGSLE